MKNLVIFNSYVSLPEGILSIHGAPSSWCRILNKGRTNWHWRWWIILVPGEPLNQTQFDHFHQLEYVPTKLESILSLLDLHGLTTASQFSQIRGLNCNIIWALKLLMFPAGRWMSLVFWQSDRLVSSTSFGLRNTAPRPPFPIRGSCTGGAAYQDTATGRTLAPRDQL